MALFAMPAYAQDLTGPRVEITAGYDVLVPDGRYEDFSSELAGIHGRVGVGYDLAVSGDFILGVEAGIGGTRGAGVDVTFVRDRFAFRPTRDLDLLLRAGYRAGSGTLLYAKAGWANAGIVLEASSTLGGGQYEITRTTYHNGGLRIAAGVEKVLAGRIYGKAEYRHASFGDGFNYQPGTSRHQLLIGIGTRF